MKSLILSTSDINGGAAKAAYRLHKGLQRVGIDSHMLVQDKLSDDRTVYAPESRLQQSIANTRVAVDALPLKQYPQRDSAIFSLQWLPDKTHKKVAQISPDIINLHWINEGFVRIETIPLFSQPVVWTLHDMWAFTGGCHYNQDCDRYTQTCGMCPQLGSSKSDDLSRWVWQRKAKAWKQSKPTIVTLSSWLTRCVQSSALFQDLRIELIPNGINTQIYKPINKQFAREVLGLPQDKYIALSGAAKVTSDKRKGFHLLQPALQELSRSGWNEKLYLAIVGSVRPENPPDFGLTSHYLGNFNDDLSLALIYSAADIFVLPSIQDNLPNMLMEALACGTPCVAFNTGGMPDLIEHQRNGYLAEPYKVENLVQGIIWMLENTERYQKLHTHAREKVEQEFTQEIQAKRYISLFSELLESFAYFESKRVF